MLAIALGATLCVSLSCATLPDIAPNVCGNGTVEPTIGEACDKFATGVGDNGLPTRCGAKEDGAGACLFIHDAGHDCPVGYGSGRDGVCRKPLGTFREPTQSFQDSGEVLRVADFDDDGIGDLLVTRALSTQISVDYLDSFGAVRSVTRLQQSSTPYPPVVEELTSSSGAPDGADLVTPTGRGLVVRSGTAAGFRPIAYATEPFDPSSRLITVSAVSAGSGLEPKSALDLKAEVRSIPVGFEVATLDGIPLGRVVGYAADSILGVAKADVLPTPLSSFLIPYDDLAFAVEAKGPLPDALVFVRPQLPNVVDPPNVVRPIEPPFVPAGTHIVSGPYVLPGLSNDKPKVAVVVQKPAGRALVVADADVANPMKLIDVSDATPLADGDPGLGEIITLQHFRAFGILEAFAFVDATTVRVGPDIGGVALSPYFQNPNLGAFLNVDGGWTSALIDKASNIAVAGSRFTPGIDVFKIDEGGAGLNPLRIETDLPVKNLARGDFDGDGVTDTVAITGSPTSDCSTADQILVLFADASGYPREIRFAGALPGATDLAVGKLPRTDYVDGIDDFVVGARCNGAESLATFSGDANREVLSAYPLPLNALFGNSSSAIAGGHFGPDAGDVHADVAFFSPIDGTKGGLSILSGGPGAELSQGPSVSVAFSDDQEAGLAAVFGRTHAIDLNGDGIDEVALCYPVLQGMNFGSRCVIAKSSGSGLEITNTAESQNAFSPELDSFLAATVTLTTADVNGDERSDLVTGYHPPSGPSFVTLFLSDGASGLKPASIALPDGELFTAAADPGRGIPGVSLVVATTTRVLGCPRLEGNGALSCSVTLYESPPQRGEIIGVAVVDVDGDGAADLLVSTEQGTDLVPQVTWEPPRSGP